MTTKNTYSYFFTMVLVILMTSFTSITQSKLKTGFYYLSEKENEGELIKDIDTEETYAVEINAALSINDFSNAKIVLKKIPTKTIKFIEIKLSKDGQKKWKKIVERISKTGESIVFICNDRIYLEKRIYNQSDFDSSIIELLIEPTYLESLCEKMKSEINQSH